MTSLRSNLKYLALACLIAVGVAVTPATAQDKELVYITAGIDLPFWRYVSVGVADAAAEHGYGFSVMDSANSAANQLINTQDAITRQVSGIVLSPTDSSTAPAVLDLAAEAGIPVSFAGIGTNSGTYVSFVTSDDEAGAYEIGTSLVAAFAENGWENAAVGMIMISQARQNGVRRSEGFVRAMEEAGHQVVAKNEMQTYTADETFRYVQDMLTSNPDLRGIFVQTDAPTLGAVRATNAMRRADETLIVAFDGVPEFINLIRDGDLVGSGMQQPYLMGKRAAESVIQSLEGQTAEREVVLPILPITADTLDENLDEIRQTVFANEIN